MFWQFRKRIRWKPCRNEHEVILAMPFVGHEEDFRKMGIECIPVSMKPTWRESFCRGKAVAGL